MIREVNIALVDNIVTTTWIKFQTVDNGENGLHERNRIIN